VNGVSVPQGKRVRAGALRKRSRICAVSTSGDFERDWQTSSRGPPPDHLPRHLLLRLSRIRIQADRLGDLDHDTKAAALSDERADTGGDDVRRISSASIRRDRTDAGKQCLVREWIDISQRVMVMPMDCLEWPDPMTALSKVAFAITGT